jgi:hypothetical protein
MENELEKSLDAALKTAEKLREGSIETANTLSSLIKMLRQVITSKDIEIKSLKAKIERGSKPL